MRFLSALLLTLTTPALAQAPGGYVPTAQLLLRNAMFCEGVAGEQQNQIVALTKENEKLKLELAELKAARTIEIPAYGGGASGGPGSVTKPAEAPK